MKICQNNTKMIIKQSNMSTRAITFLMENDAVFEVMKYEHNLKGAVFAAQAVGFSLERTIKTLVVMTGQKQNALALMPGDRELDLKRMAKASNVKRAEMAPPTVAERLTGYKVGGISPFGLTTPLPSVMDSSLLTYDAVLINGGQRGTMLKMSPATIARLLKSTIADIARP